MEMEFKETAVEAYIADDGSGMDEEEDGAETKEDPDGNSGDLGAGDIEEGGEMM